MSGLFVNCFSVSRSSQNLYTLSCSATEREAEGIIEWNQETGQLGQIDYDPRCEFAGFTAIFNQIIDSTRTPAEAKRDHKLEDIHSKTASILEKLDNLNALEDIRAELLLLSQRYQLTQPAPVETHTGQQNVVLPEIPTNLIRWLHLSDFHAGKDGYGQSRLFKYILEHVRSRVAAGIGPDLVFITGDIANKGQTAQYKEFYENFFLPLLECLPPDSEDRIFIIPGNHDVNRTQARAVQTYDVLLRVPEFLDPTEQGHFERQVIFSRFQAYVENDLTNFDEHWLSSWAGTSRCVMDIRGLKIGVLGVNTAWLSYSDEDRHKLSVGKGLLEDGLEALYECDLKIVLGHHPLDWFLDTDLEPMRALLVPNQ
jgi:predicted MPP superfamily phosphohydrolase